MPTISVWVSEDVKKLWDKLNEMDHLATKELRRAVLEIIERYKEKILEDPNFAESSVNAIFQQMQTEREFLNAVSSIKQEDVILELSEV